MLSYGKGKASIHRQWKIWNTQIVLRKTSIWCGGIASQTTQPDQQHLATGSLGLLNALWGRTVPSSENGWYVHKAPQQVTNKDRNINKLFASLIKILPHMSFCDFALVTFADWKVHLKHICSVLAYSVTCSGTC